ncbi:MAG: hypothetical protein A2729_04350 [Candidatus Buchananbacteria bacterium RIFCSPHIGHO2_01_FULL_39_14]|nr:MAG: hypothetical protein A2729_04350 [Candidatus Buchananbacteria bacterium RIFCSPHIGHO2_01_FULL_39_14]
MKVITDPFDQAILNFFKELMRASLIGGNYCFAAVNLHGIIRSAMVLTPKKTFLKALEFWPDNQPIYIYWLDWSVWENKTELPTVLRRDIVLVTDQLCEVDSVAMIGLN